TVEILLDEDARAAQTDLPLVGERRPEAGAHRLVEIGVGEHDVRVLPAHLQRHLLEQWRGVLRDVRPGRRAAGEGERRDLRVPCDSEWTCRPAVAKNRKLLAARGMSSERAREIGLPVSTLSARARSSESASIREAIASSRRARSSAGARDQAGNAFLAAATAR